MDNNSHTNGSNGTIPMIKNETQSSTSTTMTTTTTTKSSLIKYEHLTKPAKTNGILPLINGHGNGHHNHHDAYNTIHNDHVIHGNGDIVTVVKSSMLTSEEVIDDDLVMDDHHDDLDQQDNCCLLCNTPFDISRHKRFVCKLCALSVCFSCSLYDDESWICSVCHQQRTISQESKCPSWLCKRLVKNQQERDLIHFCNAKSKFNKIYKTNENCDDITNKSTLNGQQTNGQHDQNSDYPIIEDQEQLSSLREHVETLIMKLLGLDTIDYSHIGYLFDDDQYNQLIETQTPVLAHLLMTLERSIYETDCGRNPNPTPTEAHNQLKESLNQISEKSFETFNYSLQLRRTNIDQHHHPIQRSEQIQQFINDCQSYEHLLANSIVNQIIEDGQSRLMTAVTGHYNTFNTHHNHHQNPRIRSSCSGSFYAASNETASVVSGVSNNKMDTATVDYNSFDDSCCDRPICTNADVDDDDAMMLMDDRNSPVDDLVADDDNQHVDGHHHDHYGGGGGDDDDDFKFELNFEQSKVYFPEAGLDLIDSKKFSTSMESNLSQDSGIKLIDNTQSWQDNWFFKKSKENKSYNQYHLISDIHFGYMALALSEPVLMFIPNPSQAINPMLGDLEVDQVSDLSEHISETGSIIFSSDEESGDDEEHLSDAAATTADIVDGKNGKKSGLGANAAAFISTITAVVPDNRTTTVYIENRRNKLQSTSSTDVSSIKCRKNKSLLQSIRWNKIKVPDFVQSELRTICSSIPNPHVEDLDYIPSFTLKPGNASIHSGILAQFCCKAKGFMPLYFAWYKDGQLIAASDDSRTPEEIENNRLARTYFGVRFTHRRYVESSCSAYRLIVFNDNECILELKKSSPIHGGIYSVVAYNHSGHDWCDFKLIVDRSHFSAIPSTHNAIANNNNSNGHPMSPRPVLRRPQHKSRKTNNTISSQMVAKIKPTTTTTTKTILLDNSKSYNSHKNNSHRPNVIQRTWQERNAVESNDIKLLNFIQQERLTLPSLTNAQMVQIDTVDSAIGVGSSFQQNSFDYRPSPSSSAFKSPSNQIISSVDIVHTKRYDENGQVLEEYDETVQILSGAGNTNGNDDVSTTSTEPNISSSLSESINIPVMPIAEREHRKWNNPEVNLVNNPYSPENIEKRRQQKMYSPELLLNTSEDVSLSSDQVDGKGNVSQIDQLIEEEYVPEEKRKFFHSSSRDLTRYKRDYYLPKTTKSNNDNSQTFTILNTMGGKVQYAQATTKSSTTSIVGGSISTPTQNNHNHHQNGCEQSSSSSNHHYKKNGNGECSPSSTATCSPQPPSSSPSVISSLEVQCNQNNNNVDRPTTPVKISTEYCRSELSVELNSGNKLDDGVQSSPSLSSSTNYSIESNDLPANNVHNNHHHHNQRTNHLNNNNKLSRQGQEKSASMSDIPPFGQNMVKTLTSMFSSSSSSSSQTIQKSNSLSPIPQQKLQHQQKNHKSQISRPLNMNSNNYPVHSLTGRSVPKAFREQNQKNMPKFTEMNRVSLANEMLLPASSSNQQKQTEEIPTVTTVETTTMTALYVERNVPSQNGSDSLESNDSSQSTSTNVNDNQMTNGKKFNNNNNKKEAIGAIKKRAVFWQKRIEESQISDHNVQDPFPTMDGSERKLHE